jgi:ankyrin repeat protein
MFNEEEQANYDLSKAKPSIIKVVHEPFKVVADGNVNLLIRMLNDEERPLRVNTARWSGFTLLHRAASQGYTEVCEILLEAGAKLNERSIWGWHTPLHLALANGWEECAKFLVSSGANIHALNKEGLDCCDYADKRGYRLLAKEFRPQMVRLEGIRKIREKKMRAAENQKRAAEAAAAAQIAMQEAATLAGSSSSEDADDHTSVASTGSRDSTASEASSTSKKKKKKKGMFGW